MTAESSVCFCNEGDTRHKYIVQLANFEGTTHHQFFFDLTLKIIESVNNLICETNTWIAILTTYGIHNEWNLDYRQKLHLDFIW